jgi:hypothetical protein
VLGLMSSVNISNRSFESIFLLLISFHFCKGFNLFRVFVLPDNSNKFVFVALELFLKLLSSFFIFLSFCFLSFFCFNEFNAVRKFGSSKNL